MRAWVIAGRPRTLPAAVIPVVIGTAVSATVRAVDWGVAAIALAAALAIQVGTNFANDVYDAERGADTDARVGPPRAVHSGLIDARAMKRAMAGAFVLAAMLGCYLVVRGGWPIAALGVASIAAGIAYTGGPWPLGYHGLGDVFVFGFFGFAAVCGSAYVQLGTIPDVAVWAAVPPGALATAILVVNNVRDRRTDGIAGKRTLAVRLGRRAMLVEYSLLLAVAYVVPAVLAARGNVWALLPVFSLPLAISQIGDLSAARSGAAHDAVLADTAQLLVLHGALFALGMASS